MLNDKGYLLLRYRVYFFLLGGAVTSALENLLVLMFQENLGTCDMDGFDAGWIVTAEV